MEYKQNKELSAEEQMVIAFPEVQAVKIDGDVEFLILACDGIWDVMTNEQAVRFVRERIVMGFTLTDVSALCGSDTCDGCCVV